MDYATARAVLPQWGFVIESKRLVAYYARSYGELKYSEPALFVIHPSAETGKHFMPVQCSLEDNADGSKTVWVGELEVRQRMRWAVGYTMRPGKAYLEASLRILNRKRRCAAIPAIRA